MVVTIENLMVKYKKYSDLYGKISREVKKGNLFPLVKGIYETDSKTEGHYLAAYIYGPSYLSFEYALALYGLIPEAVYVYTNATFNKRKTKIYQNHFGTYSYRDVPSSAYPHGINAHVEDGYSYFIASPEKALCDKLYICPPQSSIKRLLMLLFDDLRIDEDTFLQLNFKELIKLCDYYQSNNIKLLKKYIIKELNCHKSSK